MGRTHSASRRQRGFIFDPRKLTDVLTVRECLERLPGDDRQIACMVMAGYTHGEIAAQMGMGRRTVGDRIKKFSRIFRHKLPPAVVATQGHRSASNPSPRAAGS